MNNEKYLLGDEQIAEHAIVCWEALEEHERQSFRLVTKAQLAHAESLIRANERDRIFKELEGYCPHGNIKKRFCWRCYEAL